MNTKEQIMEYNSRNFTLRFSKRNPTLMDDLTKLAEQEERSVTNVIERILADYIKREKRRGSI